MYIYDMINLTQIGLQRGGKYPEDSKKSWRVSKITGIFLEFTGNFPHFCNPKHKIR